ncbi:unnamed protein product, partial [Ectocarpus fasciculatus]
MENGARDERVFGAKVLRCDEYQRCVASSKSLDQRLSLLSVSLSLYMSFHFICFVVVPLRGSTRQHQCAPACLSGRCHSPPPPLLFYPCSSRGRPRAYRVVSAAVVG